MVGHKSNINNTDFSYWMSAPHLTAGKESILLIHGFGGTYSGFEDLSSLLAEDYNILGLDLPGYGLSEPMKRRHTLQNYAHFLDEFCAKTEFHKIHVVGHSFGADIATVFAALHPSRVDKLTLISPVIFYGKNIATYGKLYYKLAQKMPKSIAHRMLHNHFLTWASDMSMFKTASAEQKTKILRDDFVNDHLMSDKPTIEGYLSLLSTDFIKTASKIKAPTTILSGSKDPLSPVTDMEKLHDAIPSSKLTIIEDTGHFLPLEEPRKIYEHIAKALRQ